MAIKPQQTDFKDTDLVNAYNHKHEKIVLIKDLDQVDVM